MYYGPLAVEVLFILCFQVLLRLIYLFIYHGGGKEVSYMNTGHFGSRTVSLTPDFKRTPETLQQTLNLNYS